MDLLHTEMGRAVVQYGLGVVYLALLFALFLRGRWQWVGIAGVSAALGAGGTTVAYELGAEERTAGMLGGLVAIAVLYWTYWRVVGGREDSRSRRRVVVETSRGPRARGLVIEAGSRAHSEQGRTVDSKATHIS